MSLKNFFLRNEEQNFSNLKFDFWPAQDIEKTCQSQGKTENLQGKVFSQAFWVIHSQLKYK